ncbi:hypothetical protein Tco_1055102 [Tanacetum coccineum]|uniref:CCHC-type domain-containing protein n=1 Tax=Tanacetum coccineum TaxID=301880 RepID=A0ABQ5H049_9ASTR
MFSLVWIMPPRVMTQSAGRPIAESLGGGTGEHVGRGGRGRRPKEGNDERVEDLNGQGNDQGLGANGGENIGNVIVNGNRVGCSYKEFLACNPKEYDGKRGAVVLTRWIEKMENVQDTSGCSNDQKVKYTTGSFVGKALTWWNFQIRTLSLEVAVSMSWNDFKFMMIQDFCPSHEMQKLESELWNHAMVVAGMLRILIATEPKTIQKAVQIFGALTDEAVRNGSIKEVEKRGNMGEPSKDRSGRNDNKRTRIGNVVATTVNHVGRENTGTWPKCTTCNSYHAPGGPCRTCFNYNRPGHLAKDCRGVPRNVNHVNARNPTVRACYECGNTDHVRPACLRLNRAPGSEENYPNQVAANNGGQGRGNQGNQARGRAFILGAEEARQDPNIVMGLEPSDLGFRYKIEIASGQLVEIDKGHRSFDVIIGMDWLSNHKAEIIYHEKVVRIPLLDGKVLRVLGERPEEKARLLTSVKASDKKQGEIVMVRDFLESPYRLAPSELEELSGQLKELQDKELNKLTVQNVYPHLGLDDQYEKLQNGPHFPQKIDLRSGYHQLRVHEDDILKTTFRTRYEHFEFTVMPFSMTNAPATTLDSRGALEHLRIHVDPSKIEAVKNWKAPITLFEVRSFLLLAGYYCRFIENFSKIAKSLTILTHKCKTFDWGEEQKNAFQTLKDKVVTAHHLKIHEKNYTTHDLKQGAVVFALKIWRHYLKGLKRQKEAKTIEQSDKKNGKRQRVRARVRNPPGSKPDQPDTEIKTMKSRAKIKSKGPRMPSIQRFKG